jgi:putative tryptophan/tyrosine transport system substrate-binding protein
VLFLATALAVQAQPTRMPKIGMLSLDFPDNPSCVDRFRRGLDELGYVEGRTVVLELRWAKDRVDLLPELGADLVRSNVDVIVSAPGPRQPSSRTRPRRYRLSWHRASTRSRPESSRALQFREAMSPG